MPSSVTVKSLSVSPSIGLPFLSFTTTVSTTSRTVTGDIVYVPLSPLIGALPPTTCAPARIAPIPASRAIATPHVAARARRVER
jgi:hypothetical protein